VRREAVLSSQIEGTRSSLSDLLLFELDEAPGVPFDDVVEVALRAKPLATISDLKARAGVSYPTAAKAVELLEQSGVVRELTGGRRNRIFAYDRYLSILSEGTEPL
jgi:Fic family protein